MAACSQKVSERNFHTAPYCSAAFIVCIRSAAQCGGVDTFIEYI